MKAFEQDLSYGIKNMECRKTNDYFLNSLSKDFQKIKSSPNVFIFTDKTRNIHETEQGRYNQLLTNSTTKTYKLGENTDIEDVDKDLKLPTIYQSATASNPWRNVQHL